MEALLLTLTITFQSLFGYTPSSTMTADQMNQMITTKTGTSVVVTDMLEVN